MADDEKNGIFRDVTAMGVIAPSLAAATSFALISRVGLVGSLIGTAITAAVTAAATQVYKNMMADSASRIQQLMPKETGEAGDAGADVSRVDAPGARASTNVTTAIPVATGADEATTLTSATGTPLATAHMREVAAAREARELRRKITLFSAVAAVMVALAVAGIITLATAGRGIGPTIIVTNDTDDGAAGNNMGSGATGTSTSADGTTSDAQVPTGTTDTGLADGTTSGSDADGANGNDNTDDAKDATSGDAGGDNAGSGDDTAGGATSPGAGSEGTSGDAEGGATSPGTDGGNTAPNVAAKSL